MVRDPEYVTVDVAEFGKLEGTAGIELDDTFYLDASTAPSGSPQPLDLSAEMPAAGTAVTITGPYIGWLDVCSGDADGDGQCEESEFDAIDAFITDPGSGRAITVLQADQPDPVPIQFTGMLRDDAGSIRDAKARHEASISTRLELRSRTATCSMMRRLPRAPSLGLAILAGLLAAILAVGLVGGYLVFRRSKRPLPSGGLPRTGRRDRGPRDRSAAPGGRPDPCPRGEGPAMPRFPLESMTQPEPTPAEPLATTEPPVEPEATTLQPEAAPAEPEAPVPWKRLRRPAIPSWSSVVPAPPTAETGAKASAPHRTSRRR